MTSNFRIRLTVLLALFALCTSRAAADEVVLLNDPLADGLFTEDGVTGYQYIFDFYWGDSNFHTASSSTCVGQCLGYSSEFAIGGSNTPFDPSQAAWYREGTVGFRAWNIHGTEESGWTPTDIDAQFQARGVMQGWYSTNVWTTNPTDYHPLGPFGCQAPGCPYTNWNLPAAIGDRNGGTWDTGVVDEYGAFGATASSVVPWAMDNVWHTPDEYKYSTLELAPAEFFGGGGLPIDPTQGLEISSQMDQWQGPPSETILLATVRIIHPNAPGTMQWHSADGNGYIQGPTGAAYVPPSCNGIIGDANCDGYVDVGNDIFPAFSNFTGPGSFGMTRAQGDVQGNATGATANLDPHDGDVDVSDIITMFSNFTGPAPPSDEAGGLVAAEALDSTIPDLIYDASTGEVLLDLDSAVGFTGYVLNSANGFITGNHTPFMAGVTTTLPYELAEATFGTPAGPYPKSIGNVFPSGMDMAALSAFLTGNQVSRGNNQPIVPFDLVIVNPVSSGVPEPAAVVMGLMALAGLGMVAYRRRRNA